jgi:hypothetical protein
MNVVGKSMVTPFFFLFLTSFFASSRTTYSGKVDAGTLFDSCKKFLRDLFEAFLRWRHKINLDCFFLLTLAGSVRTTTTVSFG